jgi:hypothetical protein
MPTGFMIGSIVTGVGMFILVNTKQVYRLPVSLLVAGIFILGIFGASIMYSSLKQMGTFLLSHFYTGKYRRLLIIILLIGLIIYFLSAYAPPRNADAMRYHLAQIKDTVKHRGFVYRPYYHYNFPQYFHYIFTPVFMIVGGTGVQLAVYLYFIQVLFVTIYLSFKTKQTKNLLFLSVFLAFMPIFIREATIVVNDMAVMCYGLLGLLLIVESGEKNRLQYLILAYSSLGMALGCKYQAMLYLPLYILATFLVIRAKNQSAYKYIVILPLSFIPFIIASPFLIRNLHYTGDPFWPLFQDIFHVKKDYLYQVAQATNNRFSGELKPMVLIRSILRLATYPSIIPFIWLLCIGYYFTNFPLGIFYKMGFIIYFFNWFILQPKIYPRFANYLLPISAIMAISFCEWFYNRYSSFIKKLPFAIAFLSVIIGLGFSLLYSFDFVSYHINRNFKQYSRFINFYHQYDWMNNNLEDDGKVLVIVGSGQTYYLDKEYLRADPELSGLIDWHSIEDLETLKNILLNLDIRYIFYQDINWASLPGGRNMMELINKLKSDEDVSIIMEDSQVEMMSLRVARRTITTKVFLLELYPSKS